MKSLMRLWKMMADELAIRCCTSAARDWKTVRARCEYEGLSFLTITLPVFGKDFEKSLDQGQVDRNLFQGYTWRAGLPTFLSGFLDRVFDRRSGVLVDEPCIDSILAVRQLTLMFSKVLLPCSDARVEAAMTQYINCEKEVRENDAQISSDDMSDFVRVSSLLFGSAFSYVDRKIYDGEVIPKHGPGATADKIRGNAKYRLNTWTDRLEEIFPSGEYLLPNWSYMDQLDGVDHLEPGAEMPVKVIPVPKTLKTPRIIAMEPTAMQYAQQGILEVLLESFGKWKHLSRAEQELSRRDFLPKFLGFTDQEPNQLMAREGSLNGELATLDLSEASDRVSNQLVRAMLHRHPYLSRAVDASRSRKADVPGHGVIRLAKYASMGSALCFPFEAMVFLTLVFLGIERELNTPLTLRTVKQFVGRVRVYGDDLIVPTDYVQSVVRTLETFGSRVNTSKSFWTGKFRESCGKEYYAGQDVSIVKARRVFPTQRQHAQEIISLVSLRNQLYYAGYWRTVKDLDDYVVNLIRHFPHVAPTSPVLGRHSFLGYETERVGDQMHNPLVRGYRISARAPKDPLDGMGALQKFFLKRGEHPSFSSEHLERAGRPQRVNLKLGWYSPF